MTGQWLSTVGLILDIVGAWLLAFELWRKFKGERFVGQPLKWGGTAQVSPSLLIFAQGQGHAPCFSNSSKVSNFEQTPVLQGPRIQLQCL